MIKLSSVIVMGSMMLSGMAYAQTSGHNMNHQAQSAVSPKESANALELQQCWGRFRADGPSAVYVEVHNKDKQQSAYMTGVKSPAFAEAMLHESYEKDGMKGMRHVSEVEIPAGQSLSLKPGAYHVMLSKPQSVKEGDKVAMTFVLSNGHEVTTECLMKSIASRSFND